MVLDCFVALDVDLETLRKIPVLTLALGGGARRRRVSHLDIRKVGDGAEKSAIFVVREEIEGTSWWTSEVGPSFIVPELNPEKVGPNWVAMDQKA